MSECRWEICFYPAEDPAQVFSVFAVTVVVGAERKGGYVRIIEEGKGREGSGAPDDDIPGIPTYKEEFSDSSALHAVSVGIAVRTNQITANGVEIAGEMDNATPPNPNPRNIYVDVRSGGFAGFSCGCCLVTCYRCAEDRKGEDVTILGGKGRERKVIV